MAQAVNEGRLPPGSVICGDEIVYTPTNKRSASFLLKLHAIVESVSGS
jgi:hypothetical protein